MLRSLFILFILTVGITAQASFSLRKDNELTNLDKDLSVFIDRTNTFLVEDVLARDSLFSPIDPNRLQFSYVQSHVWLKINIDYQGHTDDVFYLLSRIPTTNQVQFFLFDESGNAVNRVFTGIDSVFSSREINTRHFVFRIPVKARGKYSAYLMLYNRLGSLSADIRLLNTDGLVSFYAQHTLITGIFLFLLALTFFISLILFVYQKERIYLYYGGYLLTTAIITFCAEGFAFQFLWPNSPQMAMLSKAIFTIPCILFFTFFFIELFTNKSFPPVWLKKIIGVQTIVYCLVLGSILIPQTEEITRIMVILMNLNLAITLIIFVGAVIKNIWERYNPAYFFLAGILPLCILTFGVLLRNYGLLKSNSNILHYSFQIGTTIEIFFLFGALFSRFRDNTRKKNLLQIQVLHYQGLISEILKNKGSSPGEATPSDKKTKGLSNRYSQEEINHHFMLLHELVESQKIYLDKELGLVALSEALNISPHLLSHIINEKTQKNFADYINFYRVEEAKRMLVDVGGRRHWTRVWIQYQNNVLFRI